MSFKPIYPNAVPQDAITSPDLPDAASLVPQGDQFTDELQHLTSRPFLSLRSPDAKSREANKIRLIDRP